MNPSRISPTAHYTGYVWYHYGWSHPVLSTAIGRAMYLSLAPANRLGRMLGRPTLPGLLLARHACIDHLLEQAVASGQVSVVIELAAGLSPRGWRFKQRYPKLHYIETDLPDMARHKRDLLTCAGLLGDRHEVRAVDVLKAQGVGSLPALLASLDRGQGCAVISEGLLNYFDREAVETLWSRCSQGMSRLGHGLYLSDLHLSSENASRSIRAFVRLLGVAVGGQVHMHFASPEEARDALRANGFDQATLIHPAGVSELAEKVDPRGAEVVRIIQARVGLWS